ncbi:MAG: hypothetical protein AAGE76_06345 [Pseudomonadota bacterium]
MTTGFPADWLALREPADRRARAPSVLAAAREHVPAPGSICDLGSGTGGSIRAFGPLFDPGTRWCLIDADAANLARARARNPRATTVVHDLNVLPPPWPAGCGLVTASALFDLAAAGWIAGFVAALTAARLPLLATLTFDGRLTLDPPDSRDTAMIDGFLRHQRGDKGLGGPAAGPTAVEVLSQALREAGYEVITGDSPWVLRPERDGALIAELLHGWAGALIEADLIPRHMGETWLAARRDRPPETTVGHTDLFAYPPAP